MGWWAEWLVAVAVVEVGRRDTDGDSNRTVEDTAMGILGRRRTVAGTSARVQSHRGGKLRGDGVEVEGHHMGRRHLACKVDHTLVEACSTVRRMILEEPLIL